MTLRQISDREHILLRPSMYIGAVDTTKSNEYIFKDNQIKYTEVSYVPGFIKTINEIIDNSVDVAIKTNFKSSNVISVAMTNDTIEVRDNGTGIPVIKNEQGLYGPHLAWGFARAGSNFDDDSNRTQIGMNGVGSFATNCFSKKFIGTSDDGKHEYVIEFTDNASKFKEKVKKSTGASTGVNVKFWPDLERFGLTEINDDHVNVVYQRLINLSMSFPDITFKFNGKKINVGTFKKYVELFGSEYVIHDEEDYRFAILLNDDDEFRQFSYVNGLRIPDGGTHIDIITHQVVSRLRDKLSRKYKNIKPADIKNKLTVVAFMKNVKNLKFNSQSKEKITNSTSEINNYFGNVPYDDITMKMYRNKVIQDKITELYRIKEEFKKREALKSLKTDNKPIKSEKYLPSIGKNKYLMIVEGESALGGLSPVFGRKECGYYTLKGVPLNTYIASQQKFTANKELSELFKIIKNEGYEKIVFATDQDLDGFHIRGLLMGFIERYAAEFKDNIGVLQTPVVICKKNKKLTNWFYNLEDKIDLKGGEVSKYMKGLGSWKTDDLKYIIEKDGVGSMIQLLEFDDVSIINDWLDGGSVSKRREYILKNNFNIATL